MKIFVLSAAAMLISIAVIGTFIPQSSHWFHELPMLSVQARNF